MKALRNLISTRQGPRIQILSDLHLELGQQYTSYTFPATAPLLLLAGDIGRLVDYDGYLEFLQAQTSRYRKVLLVLGNHEFWGLDYQSGLSQARRIVEEPSLAGTVTLLSRDRWDDPDSALTVLGCTLWSAIPEDVYSLVESKVKDSKRIENWNAQKHSQIHSEEAAWLRHQITQVAAASGQGGNKKRSLLVATHHAPCMQGTSRPRDSANPWTSAFATDLLGQPGWTGVKVWVFGHTHYSTSLLRDGIRVVANQRGYVLPGRDGQRVENMVDEVDSNARDFDPAMTVTL